MTIEAGIMSIHYSWHAYETSIVLREESTHNKTEHGEN